MNAHAVALVAGGLLVLPTSPAFRLRRLRPRSAREPVPPGGLRSVRGKQVGPAVAAATFIVVAGGVRPLAFVAAPLVAALVWWGARRLHGRARAPRAEDDPLRVAVTGDVLAACLRAGLPVPTAVLAAAESASPAARQALRSSADLLVLGAEPDEAWEPACRCPAIAELGRAARRTARSGTALATVATAVAERARATTADEAEARAQRAGVLITGPLGLCFLPAFLCLGVIPVVIGLASRLTVLG
ncbi:type II secretion system (T2SS) protein F [Prauserella shujinwangii]|uniref:Type II secretion system (T2SS) protein F n=1 Tax=Prauserella shujinwangii TaxID=1453103 RepID=A0A2T0M1V8_9PSEU|nr:type II secretion system F family protein [Prauserella shujinwangii]PRX50551.1 type II secretion system (T2SS) protein F [Prauserella shujinwangii]